MFLLGTIKTNDIPQSIIDNLKLCDNNSLKLINDIIQCIINQNDANPLQLMYNYIIGGDFFD